MTAKAKDSKKTEIIATVDKVETLESESYKSMENEPKNSAYYNNRGFTYLKKGDYEKALTDFTNAIELDPKSAFPYSNRGYVYFDLKKYNDAVNDFEKAIKLDKNYKDAYCGLAITYYRLGDKEKAIDTYKKAIELDKRFAEIDKLIKEEGYFYTEPQLKAINELLKEMRY